ncbi:nuclear transport factor 2 family protein [Nocardia sp. NBC_00416]|uniref:nuclear transport factor 2 family protein n=1 Tax=Nocardia sp. NBC_00416 TaxID=2975991 RepID=UPI002E2342D9
MPDITTEDRAAIHEVIALHGHLVDDREWDRLGEVFAEDVVFDVTDYGYGIVRGLQAVQDLARGNQGDEGAPLGHHVTNVVVLGRDGATVRVRSKALTVTATGTCGSAVYEDVLAPEARGWRISSRRAVARQRGGEGAESLG